jgi:glycosyltransferase involved in cell wall biosynthesis
VEIMPHNPAPLVSVLIPTFNRRDYLKATIASVLKQSFGDFEVIVSDNASAVDPGDVVADFADRRLRYYRNASNLGVTGNLLAACRHARGKYVAILGDDDLWHPEFLATLVAPLEADPSLVLAFCDHSIIDPEGRIDETTSDQVTHRFQRHRLRQGVYRPFDEIALVYRSICVFSAAVLRHSAIDWASIPRDLDFSVDVYLAYLAARTRLGCYFIPRRLSHYRYHPGSLANSLKRVDQRLTNARDAMFYWDRFLRDDAIGNKHYFEMKRGFNAFVVVMMLLQSGRRRQALRELRRWWSAGVLRPRILIYHLVYALRLHRSHA